VIHEYLKPYRRPSAEKGQNVTFWAASYVNNLPSRLQIVQLVRLRGDWSRASSEETLKPDKESLNLLPNPFDRSNRNAGSCGGIPTVVLGAAWSWTRLISVRARRRNRLRPLVRGDDCYDSGSG